MVQEGGEIEIRFYLWISCSERFPFDGCWFVSPLVYVISRLRLAGNQLLLRNTVIQSVNLFRRPPFFARLSDLCSKLNIWLHSGRSSPYDIQNSTIFQRYRCRKRGYFECCMRLKSVKVHFEKVWVDQEAQRSLGFTVTICGNRRPGQRESQDATQIYRKNKNVRKLSQRRWSESMVVLSANRAFSERKSIMRPIENIVLCNLGDNDFDFVAAWENLTTCSEHDKQAGMRNREWYFSASVWKIVTASGQSCLYFI